MFEIPQFRLLEPIGEGAFGEVWLAEEVVTGVRRAVKVLCKDATTATGNLLREIAGIREYQRQSKGHPALVQIYVVGETDDCFYYAMELADDAQDGSAVDRSYQPLTLAHVIAHEAVLPTRRALDIIRQVVLGLAHLHERGLIHRDVKPANVLFIDGAAKLGDLGLVTSEDRDVTFIGTLGYLPPDAKLDHTSDLYAAGIMLYEMITGYHRSKFPELPELPLGSRPERRDLRAAIQAFNRAAHPDRRRRFTSAAEFLQAIDSPSLALPNALRKPAILVALVAVALLAAIGWLPHGEQRSSGAPLLQHAKGMAVGRNTGCDGIRFAFQDGTELDRAFGCYVEGAVASPSGLSFLVGFRPEDERNGQLFEYDAADVYRRTDENQSPSLIRSQALKLEPPKAWDHQPFRNPWGVAPLLNADLDGQAGDELVVALISPQAPTRIAVLDHEWDCIYEFWHYGQLGSAVATDVTGDGKQDLVCFGFANKRDLPTPYRAEHEDNHVAILVLDPWNVASDGGHASMNEWMQARAPAKPYAYGYVRIHKDDAVKLGGGWDPSGENEPTVFPSPNASIRLAFRNGLMLELDGELKPLDIRPNNFPNHPLANNLPPLDEVWQRVYPTPIPP